MTALDLHVLAERVSAVKRHLARVAAKRPPTADALHPAARVRWGIAAALLERLPG